MLDEIVIGIYVSAAKPGLNYPFTTLTPNLE